MYWTVNYVLHTSDILKNKTKHLPKKVGWKNDRTFSIRLSFNNFVRSVNGKYWIILLTRRITSNDLTIALFHILTFHNYSYFFKIYHYYVLLSLFYNCNPSMIALESGICSFNFNVEYLEHTFYSRYIFYIRYIHSILGKFYPRYAFYSRYTFYSGYTVTCYAGNECTYIIMHHVYQVHTAIYLGLCSHLCVQQSERQLPRDDWISNNSTCISAHLIVAVSEG